ncbi:MAG: LCP family protein, partial [Ruminococcus sp.]
ILQLNRDTMTQVQVLDIYGNSAGTEEMQLALSHTYGSGKYDSCRNTAAAVSDFLYGTDIDSCISLSMNAIPIVNDHFGGVTVKINDNMTSVDKAFKKGSTVNLKGEQALSFVRARKGLEDSSNIARMERQQEYLNALIKKVQTSSVDSSLFSEIEQYTVGNIDAGVITNYWNVFKEYEFKGVISPKGETVKGETYMEFYADKDDVKEIVKTEFFKPIINTE